MISSHLNVLIIRPISSEYYFGEEKLFKMVKNVPENYWNGKWWRRLNMYDVLSLLTVGFESARIFLNKFSIQHKDTGNVVYRRRQEGTEEMVGYYY